MLSPFPAIGITFILYEKGKANESSDISDMPCTTFPAVHIVTEQSIMVANKRSRIK